MAGKSGRDSISRKDFIRAGALGAVGMGLSLGDARSQDTAGSGQKSRVVLLRDEKALSPASLKDEELMESMLGRALCAYTGDSDPVDAIGRFAGPGMTVGVKMNVMMTATHAALVAALAKMLMAAGVERDSIIIWDRDDAGLGPGGAYSRDLHYGFDTKAVSNIVSREADVLINIPGLKSHWLSGMAGALKNWCGAVTRINVRDQDTPYPIHADSCAEMGMLAALEPIRSRHRLTIIDALRPLFEGGPQVNPDYLWHYGGLFVTEDQVAADAVCTRLLDSKREQHRGRPWPLSPPVRHIAIADTKYGLGNSDMEKIDLVAIGYEKDRLI